MTLKIKKKQEEIYIGNRVPKQTHKSELSRDQKSRKGTIKAKLEKLNVKLYKETECEGCTVDINNARV